VTARRVTRPSFVCIVADDLGYADLGCYGARDDASPALDGLARRGLRFTDAYANSPVCSPTRFALMTGRYQYRYRGGAEEPIGSRARGDATLGLPPSLPTLPALLRDAGYDTALVGKWHLGYPPHFGPLRSGYDAFFGTLGGGIDYFSHRDRRGVHDLYEGDAPTSATGYATDLFTARSVAFIESRAASARPFLLSVHYTAPHWPWEARGDAAESQRIGSAIYHHDGGSLDTYRTMVRQMDEGIGAIGAALARTGRADDTLVLFTSDNGGERFSDTWPFVGGKMDLLEGGIRVPLIACWPRTIPAGGVTAQLAMTMDLAATMLACAGVAAPPGDPLDGIDLASVMSDPGAVVARDLFWRMKHRGQRAVRSGPSKYLVQDGHEFLFDLERDPRERANLATRAPAQLAALRRRYEDWSATMPAMPGDAGVHVVHGPGDLATPT
jgi:arylsulfatase A-like enzyme